MQSCLKGVFESNDKIKKMGLVHSCLSLVRVGKREEAERLYGVYKMLKEINSKDKPPYA